MKASKIKWTTSFLVFLVVLCYYFIGTSDSAVFILDEAKNIECAREMMERSDLIVPTFNQNLRTDKPPLHYYFMMIGFRLFGINEFGARFFSAIMGALTLLITFFFVDRYLGKPTAWLTLLILLASLNLTFEFHLAVPDPYLIFFLTAAHWLFFHFYNHRQLKHLILMYAAIALATLAKGPVAPSILGISGVIFLLSKGEFRWSVIRDFRPAIGLLVFLLIAAPWFVAVHLKTNGVWTNGFFIKHNVHRFTAEMEGHGGLFLLTWIYVFQALLPFSFLLPPALYSAFKKRGKNDLLRYAFIISCVVILFFSVSSTKLPNYTMPAYPFMALVLGHYIHSLSHAKNWFLVSNLVVSFLIVTGSYLTALNIPELKQFAPYSSVLLPVLLGSILAFRVPHPQKKKSTVICLLASGWILSSVLFLGIALPAISQESPVQHALKKIDREQAIGYFGHYHPSFPFYLRKELKAYNTLEEATQFFHEHPNGYLITKSRYTDSLQTLPVHRIVREKALIERHVTEIYQWRWQHHRPQSLPRKE